MLWLRSALLLRLCCFVLLRSALPCFALLRVELLALLCSRLLCFSLLPFASRRLALLYLVWLGFAVLCSALRGFVSTCRDVLRFAFIYWIVLASLSFALLCLTLLHAAWPGVALLGIVVLCFALRCLALLGVALLGFALV